jgi:polygalacturonase
MKMTVAIRFLAIVALTGMSAAPAMAAGKACDAKQFGAKGDGTTKDTEAIQKAIDACAANKGGGTVEVSAGTYLIAPIQLKTNVTLHLAKDATLFGSPDHADYPEIVEFRNPGHQALVSATNAENVSITGEGTIDGNGESWWHMMRGAAPSAVPGSGVAGG